MDEPVKRKRGRPPGVKNRTPEQKAADALQAQAGRLVPPSTVAFDDYRHPDPLAMVSRQYAMIDWAQQALRNEIKRGIGQATGMRISELDTEKLVKTSASLEKVLVSHKRALELAHQLQAEKTPEQLLEIAIKKIEGQDLATLSIIIKRLRLHRKALGPVHVSQLSQIEGTQLHRGAAASAVSDLADEVDDGN